MKKIDVILALVTGEAVAWLFIYILRGIEISARLDFLYWLFPVLFPILAVIGLWATYLIGKKLPFVFQAGKFFLTGSFVTVVDLGVLNFLMWISGIAAGPWYSFFKGISFLIATATKYLGSKFWIFDSWKTGFTRKEIIQFLIITITGLGINVGVASLLVNVIGPQFEITENAWANIGGVVAALSSATWNFLGYKFVVFKK
jgi:putative flippase GtrA